MPYYKSENETFKKSIENLVKLDCMAAGKFDRRVESDRSPSK